MINVRIDERELARARNLLSHIPRAYDQALKFAVTRALESMRTEAVRKSTEIYEIKPSAVRKAIKLNKSQGQLIARGTRLSIAKYKFQPLRQRAKNYTGAVKRNGLKSFPGAFILRLGGARKPYPFIRVGKKRWDIKAITSPAVPQLLQNPEVIAMLEEKGREVFAQRLNHEVMRALGVFAK